MTWAVGVFGITGVGKSTLLDAHVARCPADLHIGGSSIIKAIIAPSSVRDLDEWPAARQDEVRRESIRRLRVLRNDVPGRLLVAGHFSLRNRRTGRVEPILTDEDHGFFDALVHLDSTASAVLSQTSLDPRQRHSQTLAEIEEHLAFERTLAGTTASLMGVPLLRVTAPTITGRVRELASGLEMMFRAAP